MPWLWAIFATFVFANVVMPLLFYFKPLPEDLAKKANELLKNDAIRDFERNMELRRKRRAERENEQ